MTSPKRKDTFSDDLSEVFVISVAAELSGMHAQTLRTYDRMGLVTPMRTSGGGRRYTRGTWPPSGKSSACRRKKASTSPASRPSSA